ncbi:hypothetical protein F4778DRAFT_720501 [Xylariomycetidae sp. FL2044]|nr:hypothetical protein F4778DRAFT_720501 [Xylariomycetidae sp. FL2044]
MAMARDDWPMNTMVLVPVLCSGCLDAALTGLAGFTLVITTLLFKCRSIWLNVITARLIQSGAHRYSETSFSGRVSGLRITMEFLLFGR